MTTSKTVYALLGWLSAGPLSGYDLKKRTEEYIGEFWYGSFGQIYPMLHRMLEEGLVTVHEEQDEGRPPRKVYTITDSGRDHLAEWMREPPEPDLFRSELLLRLFFGHLVPPEVLRVQVESTLHDAEERLAHLEALRHEVEQRHASIPNLPYMQITADRGIIVNRGYVEWARNTLATLDTLLGEEEKRP